jgi:hypothetical protein
LRLELFNLRPAVYFALIDFREVWLPVPSIDKNAVLVADAKEIALPAKQEFKKVWNAPEAQTKAKSHKS